MNAIAHKHAEKIKQWADAPEWWDVYFREPATSAWTKALTSPVWAPGYEYELRKSAKHPDIKPKKRLIDWAAIPVGTMTNHGEIRVVDGNMAILENPSHRGYRAHIEKEQLRLKEQTKFTYWGGGECPVPEGVVVEVVTRDGGICQRSVARTLCWVTKLLMSSDVIGYRIIKLADGWTDVPEESV